METEKRTLSGRITKVLDRPQRMYGIEREREIFRVWREGIWRSVEGNKEILDFLVRRERQGERKMNR